MEVETLIYYLHCGIKHSTTACNGGVLAVAGMSVCVVLHLLRRLAHADCMLPADITSGKLMQFTRYYKESSTAMLLMRLKSQHRPARS